MIRSASRRSARRARALARGVILAATVLAGARLVTSGSAASSLNLSNFVMTFDERFERLDISATGPGTRWIAHTPWNGDFGDARFDNPGPDGPFAKTSSGLSITARKDAEGHWHSGLICSMDKDGPGQHGFAQRYGYFEMRARLPDGPGVWPAFWLIGVDKTSSASEIDVIEYYGKFPEYYHNVTHVFRNNKDSLARDNLVHVPAGSLTSKFNDFGVLIEPDMTRFYLNREEIWSLPTPPEYRQPMYVLANLALGGGWPLDGLASPAVMQIEHIQVFQDQSRVSPRLGEAGSDPGAMRN